MVCGNGAENRRGNPLSVTAKRDEILAKVLVTAMTHKFAVWRGPHCEVEETWKTLNWKTLNITCEASLASFVSLV